MTNVTNFRLSFIWVETIPAILAQEVKPDARYAFLGYVGKYAEAFDKCKSKGGPAGLEVPWIKPRGHRYWKFSFVGQHAGDVVGFEAWKKLVPLRGHIPRRISMMEDSEAKATFEVFYAPIGIALVANFYCRDKVRSLPEVAALAHAIRFKYRFRVDSAQPAGTMSLDRAADYGLELATRYAFGDVKAFAGHNQPFSIATFIQGVGADENTPLNEGSDEHRVLEAITGWNENYQKMKLPQGSLDEASLPVQKKADGDLVYARKLGRAIWLPREFANPRRVPRLSCYHRNLTLAIVRTLSLGEFIDWVAKSHQAGQPIRQLLCERAKQAISLLETNAKGDVALTYRTKSVDALIIAANWRPSMDYIKSL